MLSALVVTLVVLVAVWRLGDFFQENDYLQQRQQVERDLSSVRANLESGLHTRLALVQGLSAFVKTSLYSGREFWLMSFVALLANCRRVFSVFVVCNCSRRGGELCLPAQG
ncbi:MAG: hypothetical protein V7629_09610 [Motiliproteus sp.]